MSDTDWKHDENLRKRTMDLLAARGWSQSGAARLFNLSSATRLGKYLALDAGREPERDMPAVEIAIRNWFRHQDRRDQARANLFENDISKEVSRVLLQIRRTGDVGVIHGNAGLGKTSGLELFCAKYPNTVCFTATRWERCAADVERMMADQIKDDHGRGYDNASGVRRANWLVAILKGSERLVIVDQAHRLHYGGAEFLFDFHDQTGCPVALVGNIGVLDVVRSSDQLTSRIGIVHRVEAGDDSEEVAKKLIQQYAPGANGELLEPAAAMLSGSGHARALRKRLTIAADLVEKQKGDKDWATAFTVAGQKLVKPSGRPLRTR